MKLSLFFLAILPFALAVETPRKKRKLTGDPPLTYKGNNGKPTNAFPLGECEGDCDSNNECADGLSCFDDPKPKYVPGCSGERSANQAGEYNDYCYVPSNKPTPKPTPKPKPSQCQSIAQIVAGDPNFSTLLAAVQAASLVDVLDQDGPFTVFAPTNDAFGKLDQNLLADLLKPENVDTLTDILLYHVISGKIKANQLQDGQRVTTVQGSKVTITLPPPQVNGVDIIATDIQACNGVIHVIDEVLIPPAPKPTAKPVSKPTGKPQLSIVGNNGKPSNAYPLGLCEGDCDNDNDCKPEYKCFQRDGGKAVPYCAGGESDDSRTDYCTKPW